MLISINLQNKSSEVSTSEVLTREASLDNRGPDKQGSTIYKLDNNRRGLYVEIPCWLKRKSPFEILFKAKKINQSTILLHYSIDKRISRTMFKKERAWVLVLQTSYRQTEYHSCPASTVAEANSATIILRELPLVLTCTVQVKGKLTIPWSLILENLILNSWKFWGSRRLSWVDFIKV